MSVDQGTEAGKAPNSRSCRGGNGSGKANSISS